MKLQTEYDCVICIDILQLYSTKSLQAPIYIINTTFFQHVNMWHAVRNIIPRPSLDLQFTFTTTT